MKTKREETVTNFITITNPIFDKKKHSLTTSVLVWPNGKPISDPKLKDLQSILHLIPADAQPFYKNLASSGHIEDDVERFTGTPDFEMENS